MKTIFLQFLNYEHAFSRKIAFKHNAILAIFLKNFKGIIQLGKSDT